MTSLYVAYLTATTVLVLSPGATTAVVVKNTLAAGHRAGMQAAFGAALANATHATLAGLGLWVVVGRWPLVLDALRLGGAAYLAWLGVRSLARLWPRSSNARVRAAMATPHTTSARQRTAGRRAIGDGLAVNILNPAIISFYLAVVPTFMPPAPPPYYFTLLASTHVGLAFVCHAGWATAFHALRQLFARPAVRVALELGTAVAMLWLAARVMASR